MPAPVFKINLMIKELLEVKETDSFDELCDRFGNFLGIGKSVPPKVLLRAVEDPVYANDLIISRNTPGFLQPLFDDPETARYDKEKENHKAKTNGELVSKAFKSLLSWGKTGFTVVDNETLERRENACLSCPNLSDPENTLQQLVASKLDTERVGRRTGKKVCSMCGCNVSKKIKLPSEACPDAHPAMAGMNRWGEATGEN
jgi:hypothetical protein